MDTSRGLVGSVPIVPLGGARISIHTHDYLYQEVKSVVHQFLPYQTACGVRVCVREVEFPEDEGGVAL